MQTMTITIDRIRRVLQITLHIPIKIRKVDYLFDKVSYVRTCMRKNVGNDDNKKIESFSMCHGRYHSCLTR